MLVTHGRTSDRPKFMLNVEGGQAAHLKCAAEFIKIAPLQSTTNSDSYFRLKNAQKAA
jgi:hypothetical protein